MKKYIVKRLLHLIPILLGITLLSFGLMRLTNDDAVDVFYDKNGAVSEEVKAARRAELGLDKPFLVQYGSWLGGIVTGDMGKSYISGKPVFESFSSKLPATAELMLVSLLMTLVFAVPLGILAAVAKGSFADRVIRFLSFVGNSMPNFFVALLLIYFLAVKLHLLPVMGSSSDWRSVLMPAMTLAVSMGAKYTRQIRAVVLEELGKDYVAGARSRGVPELLILTKSVLKSSLVTIITLLALSVGSLLGGAAVVETIFMWDGVGKMVVDAILARDYPLIQSYVVWMAFIYVSVNLLADILYHILDPRVRFGRGDW
ncbi:MAG: ABC transporter permease [Schwartzia succinivorans]|uniref:nickel ABC transporter permease n=1 Tax=Schwartzia succinivorans TaxID=55507 RepID=UPI002353FAF5|nr:nickel ABC transporter permease [Schwartzia succinivorans]MBE6097632.1 ABC transporter permease [Schwartzia succinivorans]